jgi:hypothetical protein
MRFFPLNMEEVRSSKTVVSCHNTTQCHNPKVITFLANHAMVQADKHSYRDTVCYTGVTDKRDQNDLHFAHK